MGFPFGDAVVILNQLEENGYAAYAVGGAVRDYLLGRPVHDVDIATSALPEHVCALFNRTIPIGIKHGTVAVLYHRQSFEVTTFRSEDGYDDFRHPTYIHFERTLEKDLMRRDFTMNALAMDRQGRVIDRFDGQKDMAQKTIRMVGDADARIREDPLRIMRGIRFVAELGFTLAAAEQAAFTRHAFLLTKLSMERVDQEMTRLLAGPYAVRALQLLVATHCTDYLPLHAQFTETDWKALQLDVLTADEERWAAFLAHIREAQPERVARDWKWSSARKRRVCQLLNALNSPQRAPWTRWRVYTFQLETAIAVERLRAALGQSTPSEMAAACHEITQLWASCPVHRASELAVNGRDFLAWSPERKGGPWLAEALRAAEQAVVDGRLRNDRREIGQWFSAWQREQSKPS